MLQNVPSDSGSTLFATHPTVSDILTTFGSIGSKMDLKSSNFKTRVVKSSNITIYVSYLSQRTTKPTIRHVTSKDSDQPVYPPTIARVLVHPSLDSLEL